MTNVHRRYLAVDQGIISGIINAIINAAFVWLFFRTMAVIPVSGQPSMTGDMVATCFFLPFITVLIVTSIVRSQVRNGTIPPAASARADYPALRRLPDQRFWRALVFGVVFLIVLGPLCVIGFRAFAVTSWSFRHFIIFKAVFGGIFGAVVTPLIAFCALADAADKSAVA